MRISQSDTDALAHDTGAYGSTGIVVAGAATQSAATALAARILDFAARMSATVPENCTIDDTAVRCGGTQIGLSALAAAALAAGVTLEAVGRATG